MKISDLVDDDTADKLAVATGRFTCPACEDRFRSNGDKRRHLREVHSGKP